MFDHRNHSFRDRPHSILEILFSRIVKDHLTVLRFGLSVIPPRVNDDEPLLGIWTSADPTWLALDDLLTGPSFPVLTGVGFMLHKHDASDTFNAREYVESKLPKVRKEKKLSFAEMKCN